MALTKDQLDAYIQGLYDDDGGLSSADYQLIINYILSNGEPETNPRDLIQVRRGNEADLPILGQGEIGYTLDTEKLFIGGLNGNVELFKADFIEADNTGLTDASATINQAIQNSADGGELFLRAGVYLINTPINLNKKVSLVGVGRVEFRAGALMESILKMTVFSTYTAVKYVNIYLNADGKADYCIFMDGSVQYYIVRTFLRDIECRGAIKDGIFIKAPAWSIYGENVLSNQNGRDGLRALTETPASTKQVNNICFSKSTFNNNGESGVNVYGASLTIETSNIEGNTEHGVKIDGGNVTYDSALVSLQNNHLEGNTLNQVYINVITGDGLNVNIENNFINPVGSVVELVKCVGTAGTINLRFSGNRIIPGVTNNIIDGGNALGYRSLIDEYLYLNPTKFINLGTARVDFDGEKLVYLPSTLSTIPNADTAQETGNVLLHSAKTVHYGIPVDLQFKTLRSLTAKVVTNCTAHNVSMNFNLLDENNNIIKSAGVTVLTGATDLVIFFANDWGVYRVPKGCYGRIYCSVPVGTGGTYLDIKDMKLSYV